MSRIMVAPESLEGEDVTDKYLNVRRTDRKVPIANYPEFDFYELKSEFKKHCKDYMNDFECDEGSYAIDFAMKIIFEVGPQSSKVKKSSEPQNWKFTFDVDKEKHYIWVATHIEETTSDKSRYTANSMVLTPLQSQLIAHETLAQIVRVTFERHNKIILTPLAGATFATSDLKDFANEMEMELVPLINCINQSTQACGHYLPKSDVDFAIGGAHVGTKNLKDDLKNRIIARISRPYMFRGHIPDLGRIKTITKYATGGVPIGFTFEIIDEIITRAQAETFAELKLKQAEKEKDLLSQEIYA